MRMQIKYDVLAVVLTAIGQAVLLSCLFFDHSEIGLFGLVIDVFFVVAAIVCVFCDRGPDLKFNPTRITLCRMNLDSVHTRKAR